MHSICILSACNCTQNTTGINFGDIILLVLHLYSFQLGNSLRCIAIYTKHHHHMYSHSYLRNHNPNFPMLDLLRVAPDIVSLLLSTLSGCINDILQCEAWNSKTQMKKNKNSNPCPTPKSCPRFGVCSCQNPYSKCWKIPCPSPCLAISDSNHLNFIWSYWFCVNCA